MQHIHIAKFYVNEDKEPAGHNNYQSPTTYLKYQHKHFIEGQENRLMFESSDNISCNWRQHE